MRSLYPLISKEQLTHVIFSHKEVLERDDEIKARAEKLLRAARHGRFFYQKAGLIIETNYGMRTVHVNIWEATDHNVLLSGGISIPVCCIHEVTLLS